MMYRIFLWNGVAECRKHSMENFITESTLGSICVSCLNGSRFGGDEYEFHFFKVARCPAETSRHVPLRRLPPHNLCTGARKMDTWCMRWQEALN